MSATILCFPSITYIPFHLFRTFTGYFNIHLIFTPKTNTHQHICSSYFHSIDIYCAKPITVPNVSDLLHQFILISTQHLPESKNFTFYLASTSNFDKLLDLNAIFLPFIFYFRLSSVVIPRLPVSVDI